VRPPSILQALIHTLMGFLEVAEPPD
jgi:hypothetical protein